MGGWSVGCENRAAFRMKRLQSPHPQCRNAAANAQQPQKIESLDQFVESCVACEHSLPRRLIVDVLTLGWGSSLSSVDT